jgi:hypothetical protein
MVKKRPKLSNGTKFSLENIEKFELLGHTVNNWRQRRINLYAHPTDPNLLISVGVAFDRTAVIVCEEPREQWATALDYAKRGKVHVAE